ncbi:antigenic cell wall galactomanno protein-like protein, partial [Coniella lustricola]
LTLTATTVLGDGAAIVAAITAIQNSTIALTDTVASWNGGILSAIPIIVESTSLLSTINAGTSTAQQSANLTALEAFTVGVDVYELVTYVNASLTTIVAAKPDFDKDLLTGIVLLNLEQQKSASADFSGAIVSKLPADLVTTGQALAAEIAAAFADAI